MGTPKGKTNGITRALVDEVIKAFKTGSDFFSVDVATTISPPTKKRKRKCVTTREIGNFLSERYDVKLVNRNIGLWRKVKDSNTPDGIA